MQGDQSRICRVSSPQVRVFAANRVCTAKYTPLSVMTPKAAAETAVTAAERALLPRKGCRWSRQMAHIGRVCFMAHIARSARGTQDTAGHRTSAIGWNRGKKARPR